MSRASRTSALWAVFALIVAGTVATSGSATAVTAPYDPFFAVPTVAADLGLSRAYGVASGDFNGDDLPDLVIGRSTPDTSGLSFATPTATIKDYGSVTGRPFGVASGDFDHDGIGDLIVGRTTSAGTIDFFKGAGNGTYAAAAAFPWRLEGANAFGLAAGDVNGDGWADLVFGSTVAGADSSVPAVTRVNDGDVRVLLNAQTGAASTMFTANTYLRSGISFAAGTLMARIAVAGIDVGSVAAADVDANGRADVVAGGLDGAGNTVVKVIRSNTDGTYTLGAAVVTQSATASSTAGTPVYFAATNPAVSPWGLAFADMNVDGFMDLLVGDRGMYVYELLGDGTGAFTMQTGFSAEPARPNGLVSLSAAGLRDALGNTASLAAGDLNGDGRPDVVLGLNTGSQTTGTAAHDGNVVAVVSTGISGYKAPAVLTDVDFEARGVTVVDTDADSLPDIVWGSFAGKLSLLKQVAPVAPDPNVFFAAGTAGGGYATPSALPWNLEAGNSADLTSADINHDGKLDLVYSAVTDGVSGGVTRATSGDVRVLYGNDDGTFVTNGYTRAGGTYAAGTLMARIGPNGSAASSVAVGDLDGDGWPEVAVGGLGSTGTTSLVQLIHNNADGTFSLVSSPVVSQPTTTTTVQSPIYWPVLNPSSTPWGLAFGDADDDGDNDLFVGDRGQYVYRFDNDGSGALALHAPSNPPVDTRPNVSFALTPSPDLNFAPSLAAGDFNGDGRADVALGLYSAANNYAGSKTNDGGLYLGLSAGGDLNASGLLADVGTQARGVAATDLNGDGALDLLSGSFDGKVMRLRQLEPKDTDADGISDYVDNAPLQANAPRLDMNTDGSVNNNDQLDNDHDTVLGDPEDSLTWNRLGDVADTDDDNDGVLDVSDVCPLTADASQTDSDSDGRGDACDPLDDRDVDGDGIPNGPSVGDPTYAASLAAKAKWSEGDTHFVLRIDALGRFFQNEFTQIQTDAATLSPADWATKCWQNYDPGDIPGDATYEPCGTGEGTGSQTLTLAGGKDVPVTVVVIPKQLWTDPPVVTWINDRNDSRNLEIGLHGTYHVNNIPVTDWADQQDRSFYSCETCGLTVPEDYELLRVGRDTLLGDYSDAWIAQSGAVGASPKIDWGSSAHQLISYAAPFNTSDTAARDAIAQLGFKGFSASIYEEDPARSGDIFSPEGSHHEAFDQFGVFHASADAEVDPPTTTGGTYDVDAYNDELVANTQPGELNTWLIEEVEWSGRPCNDLSRLNDLCNGGSNRENDTVESGRWNAWMQLLDYVKAYPGGVAMTMAEVALAQGFDNAPTVANPDQADADHDGVGDVVEGVSLDVQDVQKARGAGSVSASLSRAGSGVAGQTVTFSVDADGDATPETYSAVTNGSGVATAAVTLSNPAGTTGYSASWNDGHGVSANDSATLTLVDPTALVLDGANPTSGQLTDSVSVGATLTDAYTSLPIVGETVTFALNGTEQTGTTDSDGHATASLAVAGTLGARTLSATYAGSAGTFTGSAASAGFTVSKETVDVTNDANSSTAVITDTLTWGATFTDDDGQPLVGKPVTLSLGTVSASRTTDSNGHAQAALSPVAPSGTQSFTAAFAGDATYLARSRSTSVTVNKETSGITLPAGPIRSTAKNGKVNVVATVLDNDGAPIVGRTVTFWASPQKGSTLSSVGSAVTNAQGTASLLVGTFSKGVSRSVEVRFAGDTSYLASVSNRTTIVG